MKKITMLLIALGCLLLSTTSANAQQALRLGPWEVHYNAFNSTLLRAEMAQQYGLERSSTLATINITVLAAELAGKPAQQVTVSGYSMNPLSQQQRLRFDQIIEGDAVYYIAQARFSNLETLRFFISIDDGKQQQTLRFHKEFWAN
jgi:hypothetical protein